MGKSTDLTRFSELEHRDLFEFIERREAAEGRLAARRGSRHIVWPPRTANVHFTSATDASVVHVLMRNLSDMGCSFLYGVFLYPRTVCHLELTTLAGERTVIPGEIVRCTHVRGRIHEMGIRFNTVINVAAYINTATDNAPRDASHKQWLQAAEFLRQARTALERRDHAALALIGDQLRIWANAYGVSSRSGRPASAADIAPGPPIAA